jgi:futalosine hydrolase
MAILLCAATQAEIQPTLDWLQENEQQDVTVLLTDVGPAECNLSDYKSQFSKPHIIIQAGVAGCFDTSIPLSTTAVVLRETIGDMGVLQNSTFTSAFGMGLLKPNEHPWTGEKLENPHTDLIMQAELVLVDAVTVNEISTNVDRISYYKNGLGATSKPWKAPRCTILG